MLLVYLTNTLDIVKVFLLLILLRVFFIDNVKGFLLLTLLRFFIIDIVKVLFFVIDLSVLHHEPTGQYRAVVVASQSNPGKGN